MAFFMVNAVKIKNPILGKGILKFFTDLVSEFYGQRLYISRVHVIPFPVCDYAFGSRESTAVFLTLW
jgi:hypothetical protein